MGAIPDDDDMAAQVTQQVPEKVVDLVLRDVLGVQVEVQPEPGGAGGSPTSGL